MRVGPVLLCSLAALAGAPAEALRREAPPNVLLLYADDLGYGDLGCQNPASKIPTPHLDRLADEGLRFTDAHSSSGICTPSRYALLTGRHHWRDFHGIVGVFGRSVLPSERLTLAELFRDAGYTTACIGKWHLGWEWDSIREPEARMEGRSEGHGYEVWAPEAFDWSLPVKDGPLAHGFEHYFGDTVINFPPYAWIEDDRVLGDPDRMLDTTLWKPVKEGNWECRPGPMAADWDPYAVLPTLVRRGVDFVAAQAEREEPFFLYFAFPSPHAPIIPNDAFDGRSGAGPYGDFVVETDEACGRLIAALEASGQLDETIVVFSSDNGPEHYAYERWRRFEHWSAEPFRGLKRDVYEGGHHVPLLVRWPGLTEAGSTTGALVSQVDLFATFAALLGIELPEDAAEDSHDLTSILSGEREAVRATLVHNTFEDRYALRSGSWLLVEGGSGYHSRRDPAWETSRGYDEAPDDEVVGVELYDLEADPGQRRDLAAAEPERAAALSSELARIRASSRTR